MTARKNIGIIVVLLILGSIVLPMSDALALQTITVDAGTGGTISPQPTSGSTITFQDDESPAFTITANPGYMINDVVVESNSKGAVASYTFDKVPDSSRTISASFKEGTYNLTATAGSNGSIAQNPANPVTGLDEVKFTITPDFDYVVASVTVDGVSKLKELSPDINTASTEYKLTIPSVTANHAVNVTFSQPTITIVAGANGTVDEGTGPKIVTKNQDYTIHLSPAPDYIVADVKVDGASDFANFNKTNKTYTFVNVIANHTVEVIFDKPKVITADLSGGNGTVEYKGGSIPSEGIVVNAGDDIPLDIIPETNYIIADVLVDGASVKGALEGTGINKKYTFNDVDASHTIKATFKKPQITASAGSNGAIDPSGTVEVNAGGSQAFTISPAADEGYEVADVKVDGASVGTSSPYTFNNVTQNHTIEVSFQLKKFSVNVSAVNGTIAPSGTINDVAWGTVLPFTLTPSPGYKDVVISGDSSVGTVSGNTYSLTVKASYPGIVATFQKGQYQLTTSATNGTITPASGEVTGDTDYTITMTSNPGYVIDSATLDTAPISPTASPIGADGKTTYTYTLKVVKDHAVDVVFKKGTFNLTTSATNGTITPPSQSVTGDTDYPVTMTSNPGYVLDTAKLDGNDIPSGQLTTVTDPATGITTCTYTLKVIKDHTVAVDFKKGTFDLTTSASNGTITPPSQSVTGDTDYPVTMTSNPGYVLETAKLDGTDIPSGQLTPTTNPTTGVTTYTYTLKVIHDHTVAATFKKGQYQLTMSATNGSTAPATPMAINGDTPYSLTMKSNPGYVLDTATLDGTLIDPPPTADPIDLATGETTYTYLLTAIHDHNIVAAFKKGTFKLTTSATGGTMNPAGMRDVEGGSPTTIQMVSEPGYILNTAKLDNTAIVPPLTGTLDTATGKTTYTYTLNVIHDHTVEATFTPGTYKITAKPDPDVPVGDPTYRGQISPNVKEPATGGQQYIFTITPAEGFMTDRVTIDGQANGTLSADRLSYQTPPVTGNHTVIVFFKPKHTIKVSYSPVSTPEDGGTVIATSNFLSNSDPKNVIVADGAKTVFAITPNTATTPDYEVKGVWVDGVSQGVLTTYTFDDGVTVDRSIHVVFCRPVNTAEGTASGGTEDKMDSMNSNKLDFGIKEETNGKKIQNVVGLRFPGVFVPKGAEITNAYIEFRGLAPGGSGMSYYTGTGPVNLTVYGHKIDNAPVFVMTDNNITGRDKTSESFAWTPGSWTDSTATTPYYTSDPTEAGLARIVDEIVNNEDSEWKWASGNAMVFMFFVNEATDTTNLEKNNVRKAYSSDESNKDMWPKLHIKYKVGGVETTVSMTVQCIQDDAEQMDNVVTTTTTTTSTTTTTTTTTTTRPPTTTTTSTTTTTTTIPSTTTTSLVITTTTLPTTTTTSTSTTSTTTTTSTTGTTSPPPVTTTIAGPPSTLAEPYVCMRISNVPLEAKVLSAPPNILFVVDNSSSMDGSFMTKETGGQRVRFPDNQNIRYVFEGERHPNSDINGGFSELPDKYRNRWQTQYYGFNKLYYNPGLEYTPWPGKGNADPDNPTADPQTTTINLSAKYTTIGTVDIPNAHYYVCASDAVYLVIINNNAITYYLTDAPRKCSDAVASPTKTVGDEDKVTTLTLVSDPPADVFIGKTYEEYLAARQNFANWFTYYHKRILTAKASLGKVISNMSVAYIGLMDIFFTSKKGVVPVGVPGEEDKTSELLAAAYNMGMYGGTPLRDALNKAGQYFDARAGGNTALGPLPYASADKGGPCQQNFIILITDGAYNEAESSVSVGNADGDGNTAFDGGVFADSWNNTLADVSMKYYENDLAPNMPNLVPANPYDSATHQHVVTYTVAFGVEGTLSPNEDCPSKTESCPSWPDPTGSNKDPQKIDDLWHAAVNARGKFVSAASSDQLVAALLSLFDDIGKRAGSGAAVSFNSQRLMEGVNLYQSTYNSAGWVGDVKSYALNPNTGAVIEPEAWSADKKLSGKTWSDRKIFTYNGTDSGTVFEFDSLTEEQKEALNNDSKLVDYLRGDTAYEGAGYRKRDSKLGDIIHCSPTHKNGVVYAGANDGMLHAFKSSDGEEIFAYIPNLVFDYLPNLARTDYTHRYYVDNTPYIATIGEGDSTKTVLVSGLGKGGKGYFCLNISDALNFSEENVLWEYPRSDTPQNEKDNMGYSYSKGYIVKTKAGWVTVFGNGYDSANARAVFFALDAETGTLLKMLDTGVGDHSNGLNTDDPDCNGLSTPLLIDPTMDGLVDYAYAGDMLGNLWKFDLTSENAADWSIAYGGKSVFQAKNAAGKPQPITSEPDAMMHCDPNKKGFIVVLGTGRFILSSPNGDLDNTDTQSIYGIWDWESDGDSPSVKAMGAFTNVKNSSGDRKLENAADISLIQRVEEEQSNENVRVLTANEGEDELLWYKSPRNHVGWYFDLPDRGERVIYKVNIINGIALVVSNVPSDVSCEPGGTSWINAVDACTGQRLSEVALDISGDKALTDADRVKMTDSDAFPIPLAASSTRRDGSLTDPGIIITEDGGSKIYHGKEYEDFPGSKGGVYYWREVEE